MQPRRLRNGEAQTEPSKLFKLHVRLLLCVLTITERARDRVCVCVCRSAASIVHRADTSQQWNGRTENIHTWRKKFARNIYLEFRISFLITQRHFRFWLSLLHFRWRTLPSPCLSTSYFYVCFCPQSVAMFWFACCMWRRNGDIDSLLPLLTVFF